jgi:vacuolar-type H+-ATPase subunit F/Vma7
MSRAVAIGERVRVGGYALAGVEVLAAEDEQTAIEAWERLGDDVTCLVLTRAAHAALASRLAEHPRAVWAVLPG